MTLASLVAGAAGRGVLSAELFPFRTPAGRDALWDTVSQLASAGPDFFSVTYGAGGGTRASSREVLAHVLRETPVTAVAHLTCVGLSRREVVELAGEFLDAGVRNLLALRGDPPCGAGDWTPHPDGVHRACDLVELLQVADRRRLALRGGPRPVDEGPLSLAVAAFPSDHGADAIAALRAKQDAGAQFAISQVCYSAAEYAAFLERARAAGITIPVVPGVVAATDPARLLRLQQLTGVRVPLDLLARLESAAEHGEAARHRAGTAWSVGLARRLLDAGAPGLHLYPFNSARAALDLIEGLSLSTAPARPAPAPVGATR